MQIGARIDEAGDTMAGTGQFGVFHALATGLLDGFDDGAGALYGDHFVFVAMKDPEGGGFQDLGVFDIAAATEGDAGGKDTWILGGDAEGAAAAHGGAGEVEAVWVDGQVFGEIGDEGEEVGGYLVFPADVGGGALGGEEEAGLFGQVFFVGPDFGCATELGFVVGAALAGAMEPDDEGVAFGAIQLGAAPELVVQSLFGDAFGKLSGNLLGIRPFFEGGITALFAQEAADVVLVFLGELIEWEAVLVEVGAAADFDLFVGELDEVALELRFAVTGSPLAWRISGLRPGEQETEGEGAKEQVHAAC